MVARRRLSLVQPQGHAWPRWLPENGKAREPQRKAMKQIAVTRVRREDVSSGIAVRRAPPGCVCVGECATRGVWVLGGGGGGGAVIRTPSMYF